MESTATRNEVVSLAHSQCAQCENGTVGRLRKPLKLWTLSRAMASERVKVSSKIKSAVVGRG